MTVYKKSGALQVVRRLQQVLDDAPLMESL
jgi:hypothetical protein